MSEPMRGRSERVLVALGADPDCLELLDHAADLARAMNAELACLFVEDDNLLRLSELPGAEIVFSTGGSRTTTFSDMERQLKSRASEARRRLEQIAAHRKLAWSFEVRRCTWLQAVSDATHQARVVATGRSGRAPARGYGLAARQDSQPLLGRRADSVAVLFEGGEHAAAVLTLGMRTAAALAAPLSVFVPARTAAAAARRMEEARHLCGALRPAARIIRLPATRVALLRRLKELHPQVLLLDAAGQLAGSGRLNEVVDAADCRVMLVSPESA